MRGAAVAARCALRVVTEPSEASEQLQSERGESSSRRTVVRRAPPAALLAVEPSPPPAPTNW
jgi:hypothetical protein